MARKCPKMRNSKSFPKKSFFLCFICLKCYKINLYSKSFKISYLYHFLTNLSVSFHFKFSCSKPMIHLLRKSCVQFQFLYHLNLLGLTNLGKSYSPLQPKSWNYFHLTCPPKSSYVHLPNVIWSKSTVLGKCIHFGGSTPSKCSWK